MEMQRAEHQFPEHGPIEQVKPGERFQRIKEMIHLPEEDVSFTFEPREADDQGLPLTLLVIIGIVLFSCAIMGVIWWAVGNDFVNLILGNHFTK